MSREVRRVPKGWEHPKDYRGEYVPLFQGFQEALKEWGEGDFATEPEPNPEDYMPEWPEEICTHYQMYETVSEGTPISPPMKSPEDLARWLVNNSAYAGGLGRGTATYEQWLAVCRGGWAPSFAECGGRLISGVEFFGKDK